MCRSRCVLRVNVAGHIEQNFGRGGSLVWVDMAGLHDPPDVFGSKGPEVIVLEEGEKLHGTR